MSKAFFGLIADFLFWIYFRNHAVKKFTPDKPRGNNYGCKNIFGLAGTDNKIYLISWDTLFKKTYGHKHHIDNCKYPLDIKEELFFEYFGYWEHWCDTNCKGKYGLTHTEKGIILYLESDEDKFLWNLTFVDEKIEIEVA